MEKYDFQKLVQIIARLRDPKAGCPWDLAQTPKTLYPLMIDEVYEVVEAIQKENSENLKEELGDLMLHILLQAQIAQEKGEFSIDEVLSDLEKKLIRRHPHIFGDVKVQNSQEVMENWEKIKEKEGKKKTTKINRHLPALVQAYRMMEDHKNWQKRQKDLYTSLQEHMEKLNSALLPVEEEEVLGSLLFLVSLWATQKGMHPEELLKRHLERIHSLDKPISVEKDKKGSSKTKSKS